MKYTTPCRGSACDLYIATLIFIRYEATKYQRRSIKAFSRKIFSTFLSGIDSFYEIYSYRVVVDGFKRDPEARFG